MEPELPGEDVLHDMHSMYGIPQIFVSVENILAASAGGDTF